MSKTKSRNSEYILYTQKKKKKKKKKRKMFIFLKDGPVLGPKGFFFNNFVI
jgi:hypothetical protein